MVSPVWSAISLPAPRASNVSEGEILLGELNCVACHIAPETIRQRLDSRPAPILGPDGLRLTPQWLRRWLADPSATKPGTTMPHVLADLPDTQRAQVVEALTQYLVTLQSPGPSARLSADPQRAEKGRVLYHTVGCVACHAPMERGEASEEAFSKAQANAVPLGELAYKYPAGELVRFLQNPLTHRLGGRMPKIELTEAEAIDLATYLLRDQLKAAAETQVAPVPGLKWDYFEQRFERCAQLAEATPTKSGVTDSLTTKVAGRDSTFGLRFRGQIEVSREGEYQFWSTSDDGSQVWVNGQKVVDNDGDHGAVTRSGKIALKPGRHAFEVLFFQGGGGFELGVEWQPPGGTRGPIPASAFSHEARPLVPLGQTNWASRPDLANTGKVWFSRLNCASCHSIPGQTGVPSRPLTELAENAMGGCLAEKVPTVAVRFDLSPEQRNALRLTLSQREVEDPLTPARQVSHTLSRLNCYACHQRDGVGGPGASGHADWFRVLGEADLGDEGRIPPLLTGVGAKLKPKWLTEVLLKGTKVRPYMATRMPQFGVPAADRLQPALLATDRPANPVPEPALTERDAKLGWKLVGREGLSCIACHTFTTYGSMGIPALSLDSMYHRLEWDWFRRYLPDPAALRPGTRMPTFWPEGHAVNRDILQGDTGAQIQAIWAYLAGGPKAEVPAGLIRGRKELVVEKEPVIYRNFIAGGGSRAIGVGYPERANLAFDAENLRLALIWQGSFIDASRHSTDRGEGFEPPLGDHRVEFPAGPAWAALESAEAPWPTSVPQRFRGYRFDGARRPVFQYSVGSVSVTDALVPKAGELDVTLVRTFTLEGPAGTLWFRAAKGQIVRQADGAFRVDDKVQIRFRGGGEPRIVGDELRVPVTVPGQLVEELTW